MKTALMKMELVFWDATIPLLSESPLIRSCVRQAYRLTHEKNLAWIPTLILIASILGMATGYAIGMTGVFSW
jgi:hypothetical protein